MALQYGGLLSFHDFPPTVITTSNTSSTPLNGDTFYTCTSITATTQYLPSATGSNKIVIIDNIASGIITLTSQTNQYINGASSMALGAFTSVRVRDASVNNWIVIATTSVASGLVPGLIDTNAATWSGAKTFNDNVIINNPMPSLTGAQSVSAWLKPLLQLHIKNSNTYTRPVAYTGGAGGTSSGSYFGAVYSPTQNRIYFVPWIQSPSTTWHYVDCTTGTVGNYYGMAGAGGGQAYNGGVYSPLQNRIYLIPYQQTASTTWHYIDCTANTIGNYYTAGGANGVVNAYQGGVYSPVQNKIYFIPQNQATATTWHYIDCTANTIGNYYTSAGSSAVASAYTGGAYSPLQDRIYFAPCNQATATAWHYFDCTAATVGTYTGGAGGTSSGSYFGAVYSPTQNRIYFVPYLQATSTTWHYIDCTANTVGNYYTSGGAGAVGSAYVGGVYSPTQNRIYFVPFNQATNSIWHFIDCSTGTVGTYTGGSGGVSGAYWGGVFSPNQNRIYFIPFHQAASTTWHYIDCTANTIGNYYTAGGTGIVSNGYIGGAYSPTQNRIYFSPFNQATATTWHYIDCTNNTIGTYAGGNVGLAYAYQSACYSPTQNRIYLAPASPSLATWHYIDCNTGSVVGYVPSAIAGSSYFGGVYSPTQNKIYFVPNSTASSWHYIDCTANTVGIYAGASGIVGSGYTGGCYSPTQNRIYFIPNSQGTVSSWHYLQCVSDSTGINSHQFGSTILSSTL